MRAFRLLVILGFAGLVASPSSAIDIASCGQTLPDGASAVLVADLVCPDTGPAITLGPRARLRLEGHTVTGGSFGVECLGKCKVRGPGLITGAFTGIQSSAGSRMVVKEVDVSGNTVYGVQLLSPAGERGKLTVRDVVANGNGEGGVVAFPYLRGRNVTANDNLGYGIFTCDFSLKNLQVLNNGEQGIVGCGGKLVLSTLTGNDAAAGAIDILTVGVPKLVATTCGKSAKLEGFSGGEPIVGPTHGVCAND